MPDIINMWVTNIGTHPEYQKEQDTSNQNNDNITIINFEGESLV